MNNIAVNKNMGERNSGLELLKIISLFGILIMHLFGVVFLDDNFSSVNMFICICINSVFNIGVSCFALISGYFGIDCKYKKVVKLWAMIWFFSVVGGVIRYIIGTAGISNLFKSFFPVLTKNSWYFSCYIVLCIFSPAINLIIDKFSKRQFQVLIFSMLFFFSIAPTFLYYEIMEDRGKGLINIILVYFIGRYIRLYGIKKEKAAPIIAAAMFVIITVLNCGITFYTKSFKNPFARDNSVFIIVEAITVFLIFKNTNLKSHIINIMAMSVPAAFLLDAALRDVIFKRVNIHMFSDDNRLIFVIIGLSLIIYAVSSIIYRVYHKIIEKLLLNFINKIKIKSDDVIKRYFRI